METEIELKFFVSPDFSNTLRDKISQTKVLQHSCRELGNTYFDTPDNWLRQHDIGLRIRRFDDVYVQTVKTSGRVVAGLHQRPEFNAEHDSNDPLLSLHPSDIWPTGKDTETLQSELTPLFSTNFTREQWLIAMPDGSQIEVAFDQGKVEAGDKEDPICEVELELKSGQTDALFTLARSFSEEGGMRLGNLSKAAKGYRLASGYTGDDVKPLALVSTDKHDTVESCFINSLEHGLSHWHYHEQIYVERESVEALNEIKSSISFIRQLLTVYGGVVPRRASALVRQELKWLEQELEWLNDYDYLEALLDDKGHALRKLDARKFLVGELKLVQEALPDREEMLMLLNSARYTGLLLDLSRWILTRGWQPFLDDKARDKMALTVEPFSVKQLDRTWAELMEAFPPERALNSQDYIDQQYRLMRNLYTGVSFASLFDFEERNSFRLPWSDLLHGIDDLLKLRTLDNMVDKLEGDEQEQLQRWLSRQESSILHAMEQTRIICIEAEPYWQD
ncbi:inorganic triphosphatase [Vibrio coralliilyticus]|jgi:triphosphatase|uniref:CYTH and CHAD domain-containing protein n=1 Tax=Vibrio coralliilyticus TaxID=190893 RepID=UPI0002F3927C|nr:inorganic triphosphatase [Vibrio coralliilyticus]ERB62543.1 adenylate cyclase [Vibrio coralliilyticus OCN008]NOI59489.1 inorganic triphosphatase [Vibrio coralliilyticus]PAT66019.1 inorganic triphosphatase [Vibrio coralliilyticus]PAU36096.1 inorganic triphosphatase [Vibrio coralliilyticus]QIJ83085.1 inorganic triphosphatase [Vibrio coralliilyticus OCN008]